MIIYSLVIHKTNKNTAMELNYDGSFTIVNEETFHD
jgi:hypothetical protein